MTSSLAPSLVDHFCSVLLAISVQTRCPCGIFSMSVTLITVFMLKRGKPSTCWNYHADLVLNEYCSCCSSFKTKDFTLGNGALSDIRSIMKCVTHLDWIPVTMIIGQVVLEGAVKRNNLSNRKYLTWTCPGPWSSSITFWINRILSHKIIPIFMSIRGKHLSTTRILFNFTGL